MPRLTIDAIQGPVLEAFRVVRDPELARTRQLFVGEGRAVVERLLALGCFRVRSLLLNPAAAEALAGPIAGLPQDVPVYVGTPGQLAEIAGFDVHRGCLALAERPAAIDADTIIQASNILIGVEGVANPDNVGGLFRNAAAFGADAILLSRDSADPLYRKAIRTSMGATLSVPFARVDSLPSQIDALRKAGFTILALTPDTGARSLSQLGLPPTAARVALLVGSEGGGLSREALDAADVRVRIPIATAVDSVNVAVAAAIALYEIRERSLR